MKKNNTPKKTATFAYSYHHDIRGRTRIPSSIKIDPKYREYRIQWEKNPRDKIVSDFPLHLNVEATGRCNLLCIQCFRYSRRTGVGDMDISLFKKIIDEGREYGLPSVNPTWMGESLLHPDLIEMIRYAKSNGVLEVRFNTNGISMNKDVAEQILDSGLDAMVFSVDAVTEETYNRIKVGSDFRLVHENIEYLTGLKEEKESKKPIIIVQMIDQMQTHAELMAFVHHWKTKADWVRIADYQSPDGKANDTNRAQNTPETIFPCPQLWQRLAIAWDGTVYPCVGDNACREPLGNVKDENIRDIWHSDRLNYLREKHSKFEADDIDACLHCDLNKIPKIVGNYGKSQGGR